MDNVEARREGEQVSLKKPRPTNENPNFVREYFAASRLHFIGSFRARYESMMVAVAKRLSVKPTDLLSAPQRDTPRRKSISERIIVHIDMDCFFASVAVTQNPSLAGKPIAVCHTRASAASSTGSGEVSTCSYEARAYGVKSGMFFHRAKELCPEIISVPYDFPAYESVSIEIYAQFYSYPGVIVEAVSVDEAFLDITNVASTRNSSPSLEAEALVADLRSKIFAATGCRASAGIGPSKLIARLANKRAKPNGQLRIRQENASEFVSTMQVKELPGVGWRIGARLKEQGIFSCSQLRDVPLAKLQADFGDRQGKQFYDTVRGIDDRQVEPLKPRKSIGAEASWGVRFTASEEDKPKVVKFLSEMAAEVASRVLATGALGSKVIYKAYRRKERAGPPPKYLGHGPCEIYTKSTKLKGTITKETLATALTTSCLEIHKELGIPNEDFRGVGIQLTDLSFSNLGFDSAKGNNSKPINSFFSRALPEDNSQANGKRETPLKRLEEENADVQGPALKRKKVQSTYADAAPQNIEVEIVPGAAENDQLEDAAVNKHDSAEVRNDGEVETPHAGGSARPTSGEIQDNVKDHRKEQPAIPAEWDESVYAALPMQIRDELLAHHLQNRRRNVGRDASRSAGPEAVSSTSSRRRRSITSRTTRAASASRRNASSTEEKPPSKKRSAQVTMTQIAAVEQVKTHGHAILNASQFESKSIKECLQLIEELDGHSKGGSSRHLNSADEQQQPALVGGCQTEDPSKAEEPPSPSLNFPSSNSQAAFLINPSQKQDEGICNREKAPLEDSELDCFPRSLKESCRLNPEKMKAWMAQAGANVGEDCIELVRGRLMELLRSRQFEKSCTEIRTMKKFASDLESTSWPVVFISILNDIQEECQRMYGFRFKL